MKSEYVCAVDVGTASARAGIFDRAGRQLARAEFPILINQPRSGHAEHSSENIWNAVCLAVKAARDAANIAPDEIAGLCFDATCSLVLRDGAGQPLSISSGNEPAWDTISWFDHRAEAEAAICTATGHPVLAHIGGVMSPEMQTPKLMWLKRHRPDSWASARYAFDLADFLTWRATGSNARSQCTLTCKWTYMPHAGGWQPDFFEAVGIDDVMQHAGLSDDVINVGAPVGRLTPNAAQELGLTTDCVTAAGLIDAYAGMLGLIGARGAQGRHLALIAGTSSCLMWFSAEPALMPTIWGPFLGAALPGLWSSEAGQSATGALLDHIIQFHRENRPAEPKDHAAIVARVNELRARTPDFAEGVHILPDFNGNRSPLGDPLSRGMIYGVTLDSSFEALCALYWKSCVGIALGVRHILDHLAAHGQKIESLHVAGGHLRNPLLMELYADATGVPVFMSESEDPVLLGAAMAAAAAIGWYPNLPDACAAMQAGQRQQQPQNASRGRYDRDYRVFLAMHRQQAELRHLLGSHAS